MCCHDTLAVKSVVMILFNQILNIIVQPMLSGQTMSLTDFFGGQSIDIIVASGQGIIANIESVIDSQSSQLSTIGSSIQSLMSAGILFSGAGPILEPLIEITGPGIMSFLFDTISTIVLNSLITPIISQFSSSVLENDFNILTNSLRGTTNAISEVINTLFGFSSILGITGITKKHFSSGSIVTSTGSQDPTGGNGFSIESDSLPPIVSSGSSSTTDCGVSDISQCLADAYNIISNIAKTTQDNSVFSSVNNLIMKLVYGLINLMGPNTSFILTEGIYSTLNDLLGYIKTKQMPSRRYLFNLFV